MNNIFLIVGDNPHVHKDAEAEASNELYEVQSIIQ